MNAKWTQGTLFEWLVRIDALFKIDGMKNADRLMSVDSLSFKKYFVWLKKNILLKNCKNVILEQQSTSILR